MATVEISGTTLFYTLTGGGQTCLVMHGGLGADHTLYRTLDPLGQHVRLVYYDHRCNVQSERPPLESLTMEQLADDAAELAASLSSEKVVVFGHSYGGFVAQEFALRHPDRVSALILCDTTPGQLGTEEPEDESAGPPPPGIYRNDLQPTCHGPRTGLGDTRTASCVSASRRNRRR